MMQKILRFFLTRMIIGIAVIICMILLVEQPGRKLLSAMVLPDDAVNIIVAIIESILAVVLYRVIYRLLEKRKVAELRLSACWKPAFLGIMTGILLQSLFVLVIMAAGSYSITAVHPASSLLPAWAAAWTAGFVAEILIVGIFFRLLEEKLGTMITLFVMVVLFAILHAGKPEASWLSVSATAVQAGLLLPAAFIASRNLWLPISLHFAWDFSEPGIFGGVNPGLDVPKSLFSSHIAGPSVITGGPAGPQNSIQALLLCLCLAFLFLSIASKRNHILQPFWKQDKDRLPSSA